MDSSLHQKKLTGINRAFAFIDSLSIGDRFIFSVAILSFLSGLLWLLISVNTAFLVSIPGHGGTLSEGIIGTPRFINPVLAVTSADQDITTLVYAGLMKRDGDGVLTPDIAQSVTVSDDGIVYAITLRSDVTFQDGTPLTADDVIFTVGRVQDQSLKSPHLASWDGITTERLSEYEVNFVLPEPYAPFLENLTLGILPKHIWEHASAEEFPFSQFNSEPIGAGPYQITKIGRNNSGIPDTYTLTAFDEYFGDRPKIDSLVLHFYSTEDALTDAFVQGTINSAGGLSPNAISAIEDASITFTEVRAPLPRTFAVFFNQNEVPLFRDSNVRKALTLIIDRDALVREVLGGYGESINTPIPPGFGVETTMSTTSADIAAVDAARDLLRASGWRINEETSMWEKKIDGGVVPLTFSITTVNTPVFVETATRIKNAWSTLNVPVTIRQFDQSDLTQTVIRPRQFEALLFGTVVGRELDFFSFWHSSQRNDPGLNVALYANLTTDALLAEARTTHETSTRADLFTKFSAELTREVPAIFLYVPAYSYITTANIHDLSLKGIARGSERFSTITEWYVEQESVWRIFDPDTQDTDAQIDEHEDVEGTLQ